MALIPPHNCGGGLEQERYFCTPLVAQVLAAIAYLNAHCIIHRDIKPENILYDHSGEHSSLTFYISDFGLSKEQNPTSSLVLAGSPLYMAPEINQGKPHTSKCDTWSFAVMMLLVLGYFCLEEPDLPPEKWKDRMARLPGYRSDLVFEADQGFAVSLSGWKNQLRWYGRLRSLVQHKIAPPLLMPLLAEDVEVRLDAQQCLSLFFPEQYEEQPATIPKTLQHSLRKPSDAPLPIPRTRTFRQEGPCLVQRSRNNRKFAVPVERTVVTAHRAPQNLRSRTSLKTIEPSLQELGAKINS
jgi:serine/threonine protein kinase